MLNYGGNSYITHRKQLCLPPDTVMSHRKQWYHPLVYLFCILIRSGSRSNVAVAKQSKQRSGVIKRNKESTNNVFHFIWLRFYLKMSHKIISRLLGRLYQNISPSVTRKPWRVICHPLPSASGDITRQGFRVSSELIFWYVSLEAMWYMYNVDLSDVTSTCQIIVVIYMANE